MKAAVTVEVDDDQRLAIGVAVHGELRLASREDVRTFYKNTGDKVLSEAVEEIKASRAELIKQLKI